jgi:uncharacterized iron-regulated membrane protein
MKSFRKAIFWCHLAAGVFAGLVVLIMSVTGVLLTYEKQIIAWADTRNYQVTPPAPGASRLSVETLRARAGEALPGVTVTTITLRADAAEPAAIALTNNHAAGPGAARTFFVNPYTGAVLGEAPKGVRSFFRVVTDWHRWLGAGGESRAVGKAVTGACNLAFLFIVVSGFYLWWPRTLTWPQFKNILWFKRGLQAKARDFNWHNVIGFWSAVPLFIVVLSATIISYPWASNLVYRAVGENPPAPAAPPAQRPAPTNTGQPAGSAQAAPAANAPDNLDRLLVRAEQQMPGWRAISLRLPGAADKHATFTIDAGYGGQPQKRATLTLDRLSGEVVRWEPFTSLSTGRRLRTILRFAHTGEVAGIPGQTVAGLVSLGGAFLVWTGLALTLRRFRAWRARRAKSAVEVLA